MNGADPIQSASRITMRGCYGNEVKSEKVFGPRVELGQEQVDLALRNPGKKCLYSIS